MRLFLLLIVCLGGSLCALGLYDIVKGLESGSWPEVSGTILTSHISFSQSGNHSTRSAGSLRIAYIYRVGGRMFSGTRYAWGPQSPSAVRDLANADELAVGSRIAVFYSPKDPSSSVIVPGVATGAVAIFTLGSVFLGFVGALLLAMHLRARRLMVPDVELPTTIRRKHRW